MAFGEDLMVEGIVCLLLKMFFLVGSYISSCPLMYLPFYILSKLFLPQIVLSQEFLFFFFKNFLSSPVCMFYLKVYLFILEIECEREQE